MVKAIHNNVVLQKEVHQSVRGIYMPTNSNDSFIVLNVGPEVSTVKVGNKVILNKEPLTYKEENQMYYITSIDNIVAIVEDQDE